MKKALSILAPLLLASCAFGPQAVYTDSAHSLSDTSVFSARASGDLAQIMFVDGKRPECWKQGCPTVVRVLPGAHTFVIQFQRWHGLLDVSGEITLHVPDMKPRHVYAVEYDVSRDEKILHARPVDLGENSGYSVCRAKLDHGGECSPISF
jgi:hypothetical protein